MMCRLFLQRYLETKSHALHSWKDTVAGRQARQAFISAVGDKQTNNKARNCERVVSNRREKKSLKEKGKLTLSQKFCLLI